MRTSQCVVAVVVLGLVVFDVGCNKPPDRAAPEQVTAQIDPAIEVADGGNTGGTPNKPLRETSPNVTFLEPGLLHSPNLPTLPAGGYYRILTFDSPDGTEFTFTAANSTGYGLFAASSPKRIDLEDGDRTLPPSTTLNPVFLDGSPTVGTYNGSNKDLVLRANAGGKPIFLSGYTYSAVPAAVLTVEDGKTVKVPPGDIKDSKEMLWLSYQVGRTTHSFVLASVASSDPKLSVSDATVTEGDSGATNATFTVTLSATASSNVTVQYATIGGTATSGTDFTATNGTLTFTPGQTRKTVSVLVAGDTGFEPDEDFFLALSSATNAVIADGVGQGTIRNDDQ